MYKWKIELILKSGKELTVYYRGSEKNSTAVAERMLTGDVNTMNGFHNEDGDKHILVKVGEIAAASISEARW